MLVIIACIAAVQLYYFPELRGLSEKQRVPVDLDTYIEKLTNSRKRIVVVNEILQNVQVCILLSLSIIMSVECCSTGSILS